MPRYHLYSGSLIQVSSASASALASASASASATTLLTARTQKSVSPEA